MTATHTPTIRGRSGHHDKKKDRTHWLYIAVIVAVGLGIAVGLVFPDFAKQLKPLGTAFVNLIKMMIGPIIFCTIVLGIGSVRKASQVGKVGGLALLYFIVMSTFALFLGLLVGNLITPGDALKTAERPTAADLHGARGGNLRELPDRHHPHHPVLRPDRRSVLEALFVALLVGFAVQALGQGATGAGLRRPCCNGWCSRSWPDHVAGPDRCLRRHRRCGRERRVGRHRSLGLFVLTFYATCIVFIVVILGALLKATTGFSIFKVLYYLRQEYLLIVATSSSETALPRLIAKLEHLGVSSPVVGIVVPTGYSFNLDGTAMYLTMASLFISNALGDAVVGRRAALAAGLHDRRLQGRGRGHRCRPGRPGRRARVPRPALVPGVGLVVAVDRFMSEARALTNFSGNAVATLVIGNWTAASTASRCEPGPRRSAIPSTRRPWSTTGTAARSRTASPNWWAPSTDPDAHSLTPPFTRSRPLLQRGRGEVKGGVSGFLVVSGRGRSPRTRCSSTRRS